MLHHKQDNYDGQDQRADGGYSKTEGWSKALFFSGGIVKRLRLHVPHSTTRA
jgi:hypothetical protein